MEITRGKIPCAKKVVIYGPEGIGKSTFASQFPEPVFIDTEGSTNSMDVARLPKPTSWQMLLDEIQYVKSHPDVCKTSIAHIIDNKPAEQPKVNSQPTYQVEKSKTTEPASEPVQQTYTTGEQMNLPLNEPVKQEEQKTFPAQDPAIPKALRDLMEANHVDEWDMCFW